MKILMELLKKPKFSLVLTISLVVWILIQMGYRIYHQLSDIPSAELKGSIISVILRDLITNHVFLEQVFNIFIIYLLAVVSFHIVVQAVLYFKLLSRISKKYESELSVAWNERINDDVAEIIVIDESAFISMAFGFWKHRIVISTGVLSSYSDEEIEAILYHELYHCRSHHPMQTYFLELFSKGFAFVPVIRDFSRYYQIWIELLADRYAITRMNSEFPLASVLLSLVKSQQRMRLGATVYFANTAVNYRIEQLLNPDAEIEVRITNRWTVIISSLVLIFMMLFLFGICL